MSLKNVLDTMGGNLNIEQVKADQAVKTRKQQLSDIADMLSAWLTDNTENVFEDEPEIDAARNMILQRIEMYQD